MNKTLIIALVQQACAGTREANLAESAKQIRLAQAQGAQLVLLPELHLGPYFCQVEDTDNFDLAETIPGPGTETLSKVARECNVVIIASLFEKRAQGLYHNSAAVIDADGSLLGIYRKMHIPDDPSFYEKFYFTPGDLGFKTFNTRYGRIGVLICWDQWYPEAARLTALQGADILFYPTAIGWSLGEKAEIRKCQHDAWQTIQRSHAIANGVFVASVNRVGTEGNLEFWGASFVCDPFGEVLQLASHSKEEIHIVPVDLKEVDNTRRHWPFMRDRRIDAYGSITQRYLDTPTP